MATTYEEIRSFMDMEGLKYRMSDDGTYLRTGFHMYKYRGATGDDGIPLTIRLSEDGEYLEIYAPAAYTYKDGPNVGAVLQTLLMIQWKTKLIQFEYDAGDGEIRPTVKVPLEDAKLTQKLLKRVLMGIPRVIDKYHPAITRAIETGVIEFPQEEDDGRLSDLMGALGHIEPGELQEVIAEIRRKRSIDGVWH